MPARPGRQLPSRPPRSRADASPARAQPLQNATARLSLCHSICDALAQIPAGSEPDAAAPPAGGAEAHGAAGAPALPAAEDARGPSPPPPPPPPPPGLAAIPPPPVDGGLVAAGARGARRWLRRLRGGGPGLRRAAAPSPSRDTLAAVREELLSAAPSRDTLAAVREELLSPRAPAAGRSRAGAVGGAGSASARAAQEATRRAEAGQALVRACDAGAGALDCAAALDLIRGGADVRHPRRPEPPPRAARSSTRRRLERKQAPFP